MFCLLIHTIVPYLADTFRDHSALLFLIQNYNLNIYYSICRSNFKCFVHDSDVKHLLQTQTRSGGFVTLKGVIYEGSLICCCGVNSKTAACQKLEGCVKTDINIFVIQMGN